MCSGIYKAQSKFRLSIFLLVYQSGCTGRKLKVHCSKTDAKDSYCRLVHNDLSLTYKRSLISKCSQECLTSPLEIVSSASRSWSKATTIENVEASFFCTFVEPIHLILLVETNIKKVSSQLSLAPKNYEKYNGPVY